MQILLFHFSSIQHPVHRVSVLLVRISRADYLAVLGFHSLPALTPFFLLGSGIGGRSGPAELQLISYLLSVMLSSCRCRCILAVVLYLLVSLLGIVVFVVFSKVYMFLKIQRIQLFLKERPVDTVQQTGYIYICENSAPHKGGKIQAMAWRDRAPPHTPAPWWEERSQSGKGVGAQDC